MPKASGANVAIFFFLVIVLVLLILAAIGYLTGRWEAQPTSGQGQCAPVCPLTSFT